MSDLNTYRVKIGDLEYPGEFGSMAGARSFANGANFVLENIKMYSDTRVTITTYENGYDYDNNVDTQKVIKEEEF